MSQNDVSRSFFNIQTEDVKLTPKPLRILNQKDNAARFLRRKSTVKSSTRCSLLLSREVSYATLPPATKPTTPQLLTVTGYRSDLFADKKDQSTKSDRNLINSFHSLKLSPSKSQTLRLKTKVVAQKSSTDYADPFVNAEPAFLRRLSEISTLEVETIKAERAKKLKKK